VEEIFLQRFFPISRYINAKSEISMFRQGVEESFCETSERFKRMLRKCPNHGFEDIAQLSIFINGLRSNTKMLLDAAAGGTMMVPDANQAMRIIEVLATTDYQAQHDRQNHKKRGVLELNTANALLAQNKILTQQLEQMTAHMTLLPQKFHAVQSLQSQNVPLRCDFCGGDHPNGHCSYQNNAYEAEVNYMGNQGRQGGFSYNYPQGWKNNQNQNFGWKQDYNSSNKQGPFQQQHQSNSPSIPDRMNKVEDVLSKIMSA